MSPNAVAAVTMFCAGAVLFAADVPSQAAAAGYSTNTFSSQFARESIDFKSTEVSGFQWYPFHFFQQELPDPAGLALNDDGSITLGAKSKITIATAAPSRSPDRWVGVAFGGGAYFEAVLKFDPRDVVKAHAKEWPAFWSLAIEHLAELDAEQWKGQVKGYAHYIEPDFFEYDLWSFRPPNVYGGAIHDWYGVYQRTCPGNAFCNMSNAGHGGTRFSNFGISTPDKTDFRQYHKYGFLWVPATAAAPGFAQYYFDDSLTSDRVTWTSFADQAPPPGLAPWTFGVIDQQHLAVILDTGAGQPMTVKSVNVWQASRAGNLTR
jgi:hypothetical protein